VPRPGGPEQLRNLAGRVLGQRLDLTKPLWEVWLVEGLEQGRWALISKVHHCMVDGVAGTDLMQLIFDLDPDAEHPRPPADWSPARPPSTAAMLLRGSRTRSPSRCGTWPGPRGRRRSPRRRSSCAGPGPRCGPGCPRWPGRRRPRPPGR
jgi:Wax ester synthase/diacylglycerol acyltransferase catalytic domain